MLPRISTPNHINEENKDSAEHRLKLKIRSCRIDVWLTIKSENSVKKKKNPPKHIPKIKFSKDKFKNKTERIPLCRDRAPR
jgi:hypothetical protein